MSSVSYRHDERDRAYLLTDDGGRMYPARIALRSGTTIEGWQTARTATAISATVAVWEHGHDVHRPPGERPFSEPWCRIVGWERRTWPMREIRDVREPATAPLLAVA